ncbi:MAG TPA: hypothetical protein VMW35_14925 [Myxococcota bacterium]|jgi:hypothetical protein|nr:hypothetical protein [Myxococcota bacterium]
MKRFPSSLLVALVASALPSCSSAPATKPHDEGSRHAAASASLPAPGSAVLLRPAEVPPAEGVPYRIVIRLEGQREATMSGGSEQTEPAGEQIDLQLDYRELPLPPTEGGGPGPESVLLLLDAFRHHQISAGHPAREGEVELASDRLRVLSQKKPSLDLRGAQPKENLTPRILLQKPFAVLQPVVEGDRVVATLRGTPPAKKFLRPFGLVDILRWTRIGLPEGEVHAGSVWEMPRFPADPAGGVGLELPIRYELMGFQELDGVPCAWIRVSSKVDSEELKSAGGLRFSRVTATVKGDGYVELATRRVRRYVLEDEVRAEWSAGQGAATLDTRIRYRTHAELSQLDEPSLTIGRWADGAKAFDPR